MNFVRVGFKSYVLVIVTFLLCNGLLCCSNEDSIESPAIKVKFDPPIEEPDNIDTADLSQLPIDSGGIHTAFLASSSGATYNHYVYTPGGYLDEGPSYPLLLFLHGGGQTSDGIENSLSKLEKVLDHGPPKLIHQKQWNPKFPFIVASPQIVSGSWGANNLHEFIKYLIGNYEINENRIYITGLSRGAVGALGYISVKGANSLAAAIVPIAGYGQISTRYELGNVPIWAFHGFKDHIISANLNGGSIPLVKAINEANPKYKAKLSIFKDLFHDSWSITYDGSGIGTASLEYDPFNVSIYEWMLKYKKE